MKLNWTNMILCGFFGLSLGLMGYGIDSFQYWVLIAQFLIFGLANAFRGASELSSNQTPTSQKE